MNISNISYGIKRTVCISYDEAVERMIRNLQIEGFGILTRIDVKATLKKKIDQHFTRYIILGACNPSLAFRALSEEIDIGLLLPCNVVVYEEPESKAVIVVAIDPHTMLQVTQRDDLHEFADTVKEKLTRAIESI